jgi:5'-nucleotidase
VKIVLTNDDGVHAVGITMMAAALHNTGHDVTVVAPATQTSGSGTSLGSELDGRPQLVNRTHLADLPAVNAYAIDATPAFIALAATSGWLDLAPAAVVSGVNSGHNLGRLSLFSGTLSAALTASIQGVPAIAVSALAGSQTDALRAAEYVAAHLDRLIAGLNPGQAWNINYPTVVPTATDREWREARLADMSPSELEVWGDAASVGISVGRDRTSDNPSSDISLLSKGYVVGTKMSASLEVAALATDSAT